MNLTNKIITTLPIGMCLLLSLPENKYDCSKNVSNPNCIHCPHVGMFLTGEDMNDSGRSHLVSLILAILTVLIGTASIVASGLIITILVRLNTGRSFDILLTALAFLDLVACFSAVITAIAMVTFFENWSRSAGTMWTYLVGILTLLFAKSASFCMTTAIAAERYLVIAFPFKTMNWFTPRKTIILASSVCLWSFILSIPRFGAYIGKNTIGEGISSIQDLEHILYAAHFGLYFYVVLNNIHDQIDLVVPLLSLIVLNGMTLHQIRKFTARRKELNLKQQKELRAGRMFVSVVIVLFLCNIVPITVSFICKFQETVYREGILASFLAVAVNSAANMPIYYLQASSFRKEVKIVVALWLRKIGCYLGIQNGDDTAVFYIESSALSKSTVETDAI